jgi:hypothetical protein
VCSSPDLHLEACDPSLFFCFFPGCLEVDEHPEDPGVVGGYRGVLLVFFLLYLLFTAKEGRYLNVFTVLGFFLTSFLVTFYKKKPSSFSCVASWLFDESKPNKDNCHFSFYRYG